jgi:putative hydrolase of the HAD superfamily
VPESLPSVLLLDLDDTILDDSGARDECWRVACAEGAEARPGLDPDALRQEIERVRDVFWSDPDRHREWRLHMRRAWGRIATDALAGLGVDDPDLGSRIGDRHFERRDAAISPLPGAVQVLRDLRSLGVRLGLVTNGGSEGQRTKIDRFALAVHFDYIGIEGEVGCGKPHGGLRSCAPQPPNHSERHVDGRRHLEWDVSGAQAIGIYGIWLDKNGNGLPGDAAVRPDRIVRSITELVPAS